MWCNCFHIGNGLGTARPLLAQGSEIGAQLGPFLDQLAFVHGANCVTATIEFRPVDIEQFGQVHFTGVIAQQMAVEDELRGSALFLDHFFQFPIDFPVADDGINIYRPLGVETVGAIDGLFTHGEPP